MYTLCRFVVWPLVFVTLVWSLPGNWKPSQCPRHCVCREESMLKKVYCDIQNHQQLKTVPSTFPADTQYISLKGNRISSIPTRAFVNLRSLRHLDLASNELESLPQNIFQGLISLETLNLSKNRLGQLPSGLLHGLNSLRDLYLDGNVLENLSKDFFQGLASLRRLYLDSNKFYTLSHNLFGGAKTNNKKTLVGNLTSLVELLLSHNGIGQVQHDSFNKMSDLKRLKLNNNNITTLPQGIFRDLKSLRLLSLYRNPFQCTCALKWLKDWIVQNRKYVTVFYPRLIRCDGPASLRGKSLLQVKVSEFGCKNSEWSEWSTWNTCSKLCNNGRQSRSRKCVGEMCKGSTIQSRWCNTQRCDPAWSGWSVWTPCSVTCSVGYQTRSRSTQCSRSPCEQLLKSEVRACPRKACPSYTEWSSWSMCDAVCGQGTQVRKRECTTSHQGICPGPKVESQDCKIRECAEWAEWGVWSVCSRSCSGGEQTRKRDCVIVHGSKQGCVGSSSDRQECNTNPCPVDGGWSPWVPWSSCSKSCGLGVNSRYRKCSNPSPQHGGAQCKGQHYEFTKCVRGLCTGNTTEFSPWSEWSLCSTQCGRGFKSRNRTCQKQDPTTHIDMCLGSPEQYQDCEGNRCEHKWAEWSSWNKCIGECNQGQTIRWRTCVDPRGMVGHTCTHKNNMFDVQRKRCHPSTCRVQPVWTAWSGWSDCSRRCAGGTRRRWRYCATKSLGKSCPGSHESKAPCNLNPCRIHGGWSNWSEWGECDKKCERGLKQRNRTCTEPRPQYNGYQCVGDSKETAVCNTHYCRDDLLSDKKVKTLEVKDDKVILLGKLPKCPKPGMPKNGKYIIRAQKDKHKFMEYKCDDFYRNRGHSTIRYCMNDGTWSGQPADCVPDCGEIKESEPAKRKKVIKSIRSLKDFWPWQVAIEVPNMGIHCGGSLIGDQWVLTAAHCVLQPQSHPAKYFDQIKVILGTHNLSDTSSQEVQVILVNKTQHHKDFDWKLLKSDIAILKLERKVHITRYVHPVCLPKTTRRKHLIHAGQVGVMIGWGSTQQSNLLRQIPLPVVRQHECEQLYKQNNYIVTKRMLCAGYKDNKHGTCKKDSGGGFVFLDKARRKNRKVHHWVLGGIVSWRHPGYLDRMGKYSVFTDVTKHINWILNRMDN